MGSSIEKFTKQTTVAGWLYTKMKDRMEPDDPPKPKEPPTTHSFADRPLDDDAARRRSSARDEARRRALFARSSRVTSPFAPASTTKQNLLGG